MGQEAINTRLPKASELLTEVHKLVHRGIRVVIGAHPRGFGAQYIGNHRCMSNLLIRHELDQKTILIREPSSCEFFYREAGQAIVEQIKFGIFLIKSKGLV